MLSSSYLFGIADCYYYPQRIVCRAAGVHMVVMFMVICDAYSVIMMDLKVYCMVIWCW